MHGSDVVLIGKAHAGRELDAIGERPKEQETGVEGWRTEGIFAAGLEASVANAV